MTNKEKDPLAHGMYEKYSTDLRTQSDILASQGLTPGARKQLSTLKGRYSTDIAPIEQAYKQRAAKAEEQSKMSAQDNTLLYNRNMGQTSLDEYIKNPTLSYKQISGQQLAKQIATTVAPYAERLAADPVFARSADGQALQARVRMGFSPQDIQDVMNGKGPKVLQDIVAQAVQATGVKDWQNAAEIAPKLSAYINQGLGAAVGKEDFKRVDNGEYVSKAARFNQSIQARQMNLEETKYADAKKAASDKANEAPPLPFTPVPKTVVDDKFIKTFDVKGYNNDVTVLSKILANPDFLNPNIDKTGKYPKQAISPKFLQTWGMRANDPRIKDSSA